MSGEKETKKYRRVWLDTLLSAKISWKDTES